MGKQIRFFMLYQDEKKFLEFLSNDSSVKFVLPIVEHPKISFIDPVRILLLENNMFYMYDIRYDIQPYVKRSLEKFYDPQKGELTNSTREVYSIPSLNAPVIQYCRSINADDGMLLSGRIWVEMYALSENNMEFVHKGEILENLYKNIVSWFRRNLTRVKEVGDYYFGSEALKWFRDGRPIDI
jgi:hypothetical protein